MKVGDRYGRLQILAILPGRKARVLCDCGTETIAARNNIGSGNTKSCGCLLREARIARKLTHGMTYTRTYEIWCSMLKRCLNENSTNWERYGGRGITVDERWKSFENFIEDMGEAPDGLTLERNDNNRGYCKANCRWATVQEQNRNRRNNRLVTHNGVTLCARDWADKLGVKYHKLYYHLKKFNFEMSPALKDMGVQNESR